MSYGRRPTGEDGIVPTAVVRGVRAVVERLRSHVAEWPRRHIEQQVEAVVERD